MFSIIQAAGWPIWPLLLCSVVALALVIERFSSLRTRRIAPANLLEEVLGVSSQAVPSPEIVARLAENSVLGQVLASGLRALHMTPRPTEQQLGEVFESAGRRAAHELERYLNTLGTIATAAPLLGLLGTVVGMIEIFGSQTPGSSNPTLLAHGISTALYNTAFGLMVAIPFTLIHAWLQAKTDALVDHVEMAAAKFLNAFTPKH